MRPVGKTGGEKLCRKWGLGVSKGLYGDLSERAHEAVGGLCAEPVWAASGAAQHCGAALV